MASVQETGCHGSQVPESGQELLQIAPNEAPGPVYYYVICRFFTVILFIEIEH